VGGTTKDKKFTLHREECLAACSGGPMMRVNDVFHENLTTAKIDKILDSLA
jgi:NADH-quinone oxidoreductase subunit E